MQYTIHIRLKPDVADAQGSAINNALQQQGFSSVHGVRVGKIVDITVVQGTTLADVHAMCKALLVNSVIEHYSVTSA